MSHATRGHPDLRREFGARLEVLLSRAGMTAHTLAKRMGVSGSMAWRWQCGHSLPSAPHLVTLAGLFGVSVDHLLGIEHPDAARLRAALAEASRHCIGTFGRCRRVLDMQQQRERLTVDKKKPNRPELVARYGFDTKYAGHLLRLGFQGIELAETGRLTLPMPPVQRTHILAVRQGQVPLADVLRQAQRMEEQLASLREHGPFANRFPDRERVEAFVVALYARRLAG